MTDYAAVAASSTGAAVTERSGTASSDTVPAPSRLLVRNTGVGSHNVDIAVAGKFDGMQAGDPTVGIRRHALAASEIKWILVPGNYGDANGRCALTIDGTAAEIKYYVLAP